jgi:hypothetical protein
MQALIVLYNAPLQMKRLTKPEYRFQLQLERTRHIQTLSTDEHLVARLERDVNQMETDGPTKWCATYRGVYYIAFELGSDWMLPFGLDSLDPWAGRSLLVHLHNVWMTLYLIWNMHTSTQETISAQDNWFRVLTLAFQTSFVLIVFTAEMRRWQWLHFFNWSTKRRVANWSNAALCFCLWSETLSICGTDDASGEKTCLGETGKNAQSSFTVFIWGLGKVCNVMNFASETPSVLLLGQVSLLIAHMSIYGNKHYLG